MPPLPERGVLLSLRFNDTGWWGDLHPAPLAFENILLAESWSGFSLDMTGEQPRLLAYRVAETDSKTNLNLASGSIRFWCAPGFTSSSVGGTGIGTWGRLLDVGEFQAKPGWLALSVSPDGNAIQLNASGVVLLQAPIDWTRGLWHQVTVSLWKRT